MRITRSTSETTAFVLTLDAIRRLYAELTSVLGTVAVSASCSDKLNRTFESIEELEAFGNPRRAAIEELTLASRDESYKNRFSLTLNAERRRNVRVSIDAEEAVAIRLNDLCTDVLDATRPWYSWITRIDWYLFVIGGWMAAQMAGLAFFLIRNGNAPLTFSSDAFTAGEFARSFGIGILPILVGIALNIVRNKAFPAGSFAFGDGAARHSNAEVVRTVVIAAFAISVVSSVVVSWLLG
jgi:hypothetical protein